MFYDDDLEKVFKDASDSFEEPHYSEEDWGKLEERLDKDEKKRRPFYYLMIAALLPIFISFYFGIEHVKNRQGDEEVKNVESSEIVPVNEKKSADAELSQRSEYGGEQDVARSDLNNRESAVDSLSKNHESNSNRLAGVSSVPARETKQERETGIENTIQGNSNTRYSNINPQPHARSRDFEALNAVNNLSLSQSGIVQSFSNSNEDNRLIDHGSKRIITPLQTINTNPKNSLVIPVDLFSTYAQITLDTTKTVFPVPTQEQLLAFADENSQESMNKFSWGVLLVPSTSSVSSSNENPLSIGAGLNASWQLTPKLEAKLIATYNGQRHQTPGTTYTNINNYWGYYTASYVPEMVEATNRIIEVPIQLEYAVWEKDANKIELLGGLSNNIAFNEKHDFSFAEGVNMGNIQNQSWEVFDDQVNLASHIRLGVSYERAISPAASISVQPFHNLPISKTGWGDLELGVTGIAIGLELKKN